MQTLFKRLTDLMLACCRRFARGRVLYQDRELATPSKLICEWPRSSPDSKRTAVSKSVLLSTVFTCACTGPQPGPRDDTPGGHCTSNVCCSLMFVATDAIVRRTAAHVSRRTPQAGCVRRTRFCASSHDSNARSDEHSPQEWLDGRKRQRRRFLRAVCAVTGVTRGCER